MSSKTIEFTRGFTYKDVRFGWQGKKLFRLPFNNGRAHLTLMEVEPKEHEGNMYYRCRRDRVAVKRAEEMTEKVFWTVNKK